MNKRRLQLTLCGEWTFDDVAALFREIAGELGEPSEVRTVRLDVDEDDMSDPANPPLPECWVEWRVGDHIRARTKPRQESSLGEGSPTLEFMLTEHVREDAARVRAALERVCWGRFELRAGDIWVSASTLNAAGDLEGALALIDLPAAQREVDPRAQIPGLGLFPHQAKSPRSALGNRLAKLRTQVVAALRAPDPK